MDNTCSSLSKDMDNTGSAVHPPSQDCRDGDSQSGNKPFGFSADGSGACAVCDSSVIEKLEHSLDRKAGPEASLQFSNKCDFLDKKMKNLDENTECCDSRLSPQFEEEKEFGGQFRDAEVMSCDSVIKGDSPPSLLSSGDLPCEEGLHLDELNDDAILEIAKHLDARDIRFGLSKVCQRFSDMFDNDNYWKTRVHMKCPKTYPAVPVEQFSWVDACVSREDSYRVWENWTENTTHFKYGYNINGEVDVVHLMKEGRFLVSGDRNRVLNLVDLDKWEESPDSDQEKIMKDMLVHTDSTHGGWIWSMASVGDTLITGSWDTKIRLFDIAAPGCTVSQTFKCSTAVLSLYAEDNEVIASCFKEVVFLDRRTSKQSKFTFHTKPVLCVVGDERYVVTGSEDKTLCVHDRRQIDRVLHRHKLENYPMCMSYIDNQLWFGDKLGQLHLLDGTNGVFNHVGTYKCHGDKLTSVVATQGAIFTCSGDKTVQVSEPTQDPDVIASLAVHNKQVAKITFGNGTLASAGGDECVAVWIPKIWADRTSYSLL